MSGPPAGPTTRQRVREVFSSGPFRRLFATRAVSQLGDGLFQLAAADLLLFDRPGENPALTLTALIAVTLIPFSVVVPFVGVFIDRWDRRKILTYTPTARAALATLLPLTVVGGTEGPAFYAIVLVVLSANRLFLATMSAVLPQLVPEDDLLVANSAAATGGSIASVTGLGIGAATAAVAGGTRAAVVAAAGFGIAAWLAHRLPVHRGHPSEAGPLLAELRAVLVEMADGARHVRRSPRTAYALSAVGVGQLLVGVVTGATAVVFIARLRLGVGSIASLLGAIGIGLGIGVVVVPLVARRVREDFIVPVSFLLGSAGVMASAVSLTRPVMTAGALVVGIGYAFAKIPVDTIVQEEMPDAFRGRAFALYDMLFNVARVAGTALAALAVEAGARVESVVLAGGGAYLLASGMLAAAARRIVGVRRSKRRAAPAPASVPLPAGELVTVRAYAGSRADEEPRAVVVGGREVPVEDIEWRATCERAGERRRVFVVRVGGSRVRLAHVEETSLWEIERILPPRPEGP